MKRLFKLFAWLLVLLLVIGGCTFGVSMYLAKTSGNINIMIVGIDSREGLDSARSDTLMIAHINEDHDDVSLTSIPRDSYVYIPDVGYEDKINHAYAYGGLEGTTKTLNHLFENEFEYYIELDFTHMIALVDTIDGIELTPSASFCEMDEQDNANQYCFDEGVSIHMNGAQALAYARHRKSDSDLFRAARQQEVIKAMLYKVKGSNPFTMYRFYKDFEDICNTNLGFMDFMKYSDLIFQDFDVKQEVAEGESGYMYSEQYGQNLSYFFLDEEWVLKKINEFRH